MVSSETTGGMVDCSVGSIVWVRRRNGSWWPGKILGPEELSLSHVTTPRSGTPVKLLGREDASVDWYNLEKSKRVKSFRCGEFDDCIERAEASQGMPPKKREKYARREDAILHALELERQLLEKKYGKLGNSTNSRSKRSPDAVTSSGYLENGTGSKKDPRSGKPSISEKSVSEQHFYEEAVKDANQLSGDDDSAGALPRMRGLQDFGLRTAPPPREDVSGIASRAKRSRYAYSPYDSGDYVLDNQTLSSQVEIPVSKLEESERPHDADEDCKTESTEDTETDCSVSESMESDSDDEMAALSDDSASIELRPKYPRRIDADENHGSISSSDDIDDSSYGDDPETLSGEVSKWRLKGKRNLRSTGKRYPDGTEIEVPRGRINGRKNADFRSGYTNKNFRDHMTRYGSTGLNSYGHDIADMEGSTWSNNQTSGFWDDSREYGHHSSFGRQVPGDRSLLLDANIRVDANNYPKDVPLVSLISKINGRAIIGHPIKVEVVHSPDDLDLSQLLKSRAPLPCVWKTGRRTSNSRARRPFSSLAPDGDRKHNYQFSEQDGNFPFGSEIGNLGQKRTSGPDPNPKIRTLSSIASEEQNQSDSRSGGSDSQVDVLSKNEYIPAGDACIPVSLVFSRLREELNH